MVFYTLVLQFYLKIGQKKKENDAFLRKKTEGKENSHCTKKFSIKDFFSKCDLIRNFPRIWSHLLKKSLMENFIFCAVSATIIISVGRKRTVFPVKLKLQGESFEQTY